MNACNRDKGIGSGENGTQISGLLVTDEHCGLSAFFLDFPIGSSPYQQCMLVPSSSPPQRSAHIVSHQISTPYYNRQ